MLMVTVVAGHKTKQKVPADKDYTLEYVLAQPLWVVHSVGAKRM